MRCNLKTTQLPNKCPKCGAKLKTEKCRCGHTVVQEKTNLEKAWMRRMSDYSSFGFGW